MGLDELLARRDVVAHEVAEDRVRLHGVLDVDPEQRCGAAGSIVVSQSCSGVHLAEALEAVVTLALSVSISVVAVLVGVDVVLVRPTIILYSGGWAM